MELARRKVSTNTMNSCLKLIDTSTLQLLAVHYELQPFSKFGMWPIKAFFYMILRVKSGKANKQINDNKAKTEGEGEGEGEGALPVEPKVRKSKGRPTSRKKGKKMTGADTADLSGQPVPGGEPTNAVQPLAVTQPPAVAQLPIVTQTSMAAQHIFVAPYALHGHADANEGEYIDFEAALNDLDTTMASSFAGLNMSSRTRDEDMVDIEGGCIDL